MPKHKILFSHHPLLLPVIKQLAKEAEIIVTVPNAASQLNSLDIQAKALKDFTTTETPDLAFLWAGQVVAALPGIVQGINGGVGEWLKQTAYPFYYPRLADLGFIVLALDNLKPDLIVIHNDVESSLRTMAMWGQANGVPVLHVPHAIYRFVNRTEFGTDIHDIISASHLAAAGPFQKEWYTKLGMNPDNIFETGMPHFDPWVNRPRLPKNVARQKLGLAPHKPTIAYGGTWGQNTNFLGVSNEWQVCYLMFLECARELSKQGVQFVVSCHPNAGEQNWGWHFRQAQQAGVELSVSPSNFEVILDAADVYFAYGGSNSLLEAAFNPDIRLLTTHAYEDDLCVGKIAIEPEPMLAGLKHALLSAPPPKTAMLTKYLGECDGLAWRRVAELCRRLTGEN